MWSDAGGERTRRATLADPDADRGAWVYDAWGRTDADADGLLTALGWQVAGARDRDESREGGSGDGEESRRG